MRTAWLGPFPPFSMTRERQKGRETSSGCCPTEPTPAALPLPDPEPLDRRCGVELARGELPVGLRRGTSLEAPAVELAGERGASLAGGEPERRPALDLVDPRPSERRRGRRDVRRCG